MARPRTSTHPFPALVALAAAGLAAQAAAPTGQIAGLAAQVAASQAELGDRAHGLTRPGFDSLLYAVAADPTLAQAYAEGMR